MYSRKFVDSPLSLPPETTGQILINNQVSDLTLTLAEPSTVLMELLNTIKGDERDTATITTT